MTHIQQQFLRKIEDLSDLLRYPQPTIGLIIKGIWSASQHWSGGQPFEDAEDFAYHRFSWRVQDNLAPDARLDRALQLLASSVPLGMLVFRDLEAQLDDPAEHDGAEELHRPPCFAGLRPTAVHATSGCCLSAVPIVARGNNLAVGPDWPVRLGSCSPAGIAVWWLCVVWCRARVSKVGFTGVFRLPSERRSYSRFSPSSSPAIKTPMKTAAKPPIVKFSDGEDGRSARFPGWTFRVSAGEVVAGSAVSCPASRKLAEATAPPLGVAISIWRSRKRAIPLVEQTGRIVAAAMVSVPASFTVPPHLCCIPPRRGRMRGGSTLDGRTQDVRQILPYGPS